MPHQRFKHLHGSQSGLRAPFAHQWQDRERLSLGYRLSRTISTTRVSVEGISSTNPNLTATDAASDGTTDYFLLYGGRIVKKNGTSIATIPLARIIDYVNGKWHVLRSTDGAVFTGADLATYPTNFSRISGLELRRAKRLVAGTGPTKIAKFANVLISNLFVSPNFIRSFPNTPCKGPGREARTRHNKAQLLKLTQT